jgi:hypothetical protein
VLANEFPHRHAGEPDQVEAARYIADQLLAAGLEVEEIETPILGWEITEGPLLEVTHPIRQVLDCAPYVYSGSTPGQGIEGRLQKVGPVYMGGSEPWTKYAIVDEEGKKRALLVACPNGPAQGRRGTPAGSVTTADGPSYSWPSCIVGQEAMALFDKWLTQGVTPTVRYFVQTEHKPNCPSITVRGVVRGETYPDEIVVFGVHHDAVGAIGYPPSVDSPGANDNASGVAIMIELARHLAAEETPRTIWFCSFDGEERNLMGSADFVRTLSEEGRLAQVVAYVGIDQAAYGDKFWVLASDDAAHLQPRINLRELAQGVIDEMGISAPEATDKATPLHAASDHWPFYYAGVPAILTGWHPFEGYHRGTDTAVRCNNDRQFLTTANVTTRLLRRVLSLPELGRAERPLSAGYVITPPPG